MRLVKWTDQIEYLVNRKFRGSKVPPPISPLSSRNDGGKENHETYQKLQADIKSYKDGLFKKTQAEVKILYDAEYDKEVEAKQLILKLEEQSRFFNLQSSNADFIYWSKMAHWSLDEAIALSFGKSPEIVSWKKVAPFTFNSTFAKEYEKRRELALRYLSWKKLYDPMAPSIFISWAIELDIDLPADLISNVEEKSGVSINWFEKYKELKTATDNLKIVIKNKQDDEISVTENYTNDLLIILNLAINEFFYPRKSKDPKKDEVIEWLKIKGKELKVNVSDNIAEAIFTIIKPNDHNPKIKRAQPQQ